MGETLKVSLHILNAKVDNEDHVAYFPWEALLPSCYLSVWLLSESTWSKD